MDGVARLLARRIQDQQDFSATLGPGTDGYAVTYDHDTALFGLGAFEAVGVAAGLVSAHASLTAAHGATGEVVGTTNTQDLTNKTLTTPTIGSFTNAAHNHQDAAGGATLDHGLALTGLGDDDHTQYLLATGSRAGASAGAQTFTNGIVVPTIAPPSDSTTAITMRDTAGNSIATVDTVSNGIRIGRLTSAANGCLSIGSQLATPNYAIRIDRTQSTPTLTTVGALNGEFQINNVGTATILFGLSYAPRANHATGTLADLAGIRINTRMTGAGTVTRGMAIYVRSNDNTGGGTVGSNYGLYMESQSAGSSNYAIYTNAGLVRFGDQVQLVAGTTALASINVPHGAAPTSPVNGDMWTTTAGLFVQINGSTVGPLS